jgi:hypothetical protein
MCGLQGGLMDYRLSWDDVRRLNGYYYRNPHSSDTHRSWPDSSFSERGNPNLRRKINLVVYYRVHGGRSNKEDQMTSCFVYNANLPANTKGDSASLVCSMMMHRHS